MVGKSRRTTASHSRRRSAPPPTDDVDKPPAVREQISEAASSFDVPASSLHDQPTDESSESPANKSNPAWSLDAEIIKRLTSSRLERGLPVEVEHICRSAQTLMLLSRAARQQFPGPQGPDRAWAEQFLHSHPQFAALVAGSVSLDGGSEPSAALEKEVETCKGLEQEVEACKGSEQPQHDAEQANDERLEERGPVPAAILAPEKVPLSASNGIATGQKKTTKNEKSKAGSKKRRREEEEEEISVHPSKLASMTSSPNKKDVVRMLLRSATRDFVGRAAEQQQLTSALCCPDTLTLSVTGPAGVGKTELMLQVLAAGGLPFKHMLWVCADTPDTVRSSFLHIARLLGVSISQDLSTLINNVFSACVCERSIIVYDNMPSPKHVDEYVPLDTQCLTCVFTSQYASWDSDFSVNLGFLEPAVATKYLTDHMADLKEEQASELAVRLGCLPLALKVMVAFREREGARDEEVFPLLTMPGFLECRLATNEKRDYSKPLADILNGALTAVKEAEGGRAALDFLKLLAVLGSREAMELHSMTGAKSERKTKIVALLKKYCLVQIQAGDIILNQMLKCVVLSAEIE